MIPVILESPFAGEVERNVRYARLCLRDCLERGEAPFASHLLFTQEGVLQDDIPEERTLGILAGFVWRELARKTVVYIDLGITPGMAKGIEHAREHHHALDFRNLPFWPR